MNEGVGIEWISKWLGHTEIDRTLKHYARFLPATDHDIVDRLDALRLSAQRKVARDAD